MSNRSHRTDYLTREFDVPVFCQIGPEYYTRHKNGLDFDFSHFTKFPQEYESTFLPYAKMTDILNHRSFLGSEISRLFFKGGYEKTRFQDFNNCRYQL